jgi:hypothetical protein
MRAPKDSTAPSQSIPPSRGTNTVAEGCRKHAKFGANTSGTRTGTRHSRKSRVILGSRVGRYANPSPHQTREDDRADRRRRDRREPTLKDDTNRLRFLKTPAEICHRIRWGPCARAELQSLPFAPSIASRKSRGRDALVCPTLAARLARDGPMIKQKAPLLRPALKQSLRDDAVPFPIYWGVALIARYALRNHRTFRREQFCSANMRVRSLSESLSGGGAFPGIRTHRRARDSRQLVRARVRR